MAPVRDNVTEARARLAAAEQEVQEARDALAAGRPGNAVGDIRAAEDAVAQTTTLLDAVGRLATDLDAAAGRVAEVRAETEKDLAEARALVAAGNRSGLAPQIARAEAALASADAALRPADGSPPDPLAALRQLEEADIALEQALSVARDAQTQMRRAAASLDQALLTARSTIAAAGDFIATRRGAVGPEARTRLAEAQRHLEVAVDQGRDDPVAALREAHQATPWPSRRSTWPRTTSRGGPAAATAAGTAGGRVRRAVRRRPRGGVDLGSLVLGGILLGGGGAAATAVASAAAGAVRRRGGRPLRRRQFRRLRRRRTRRRPVLTSLGLAAGPLGTVSPRWDGVPPRPHEETNDAHPRHPWPNGTPCWIDYGAADIDAAKAFYTAVLGWDYTGGEPEFGGYLTASRERRAGRRDGPAAGPGRPAALDDLLRRGRRRGHRREDHARPAAR